MKLRKLTDLKNLRDNRVVLRVDLNVPLKKGKIIDDTRLKAIQPTVEYLLGQKTAVIILTHLGRPKGKRVKEFSTQILVKPLESIFKSKVIFFDGLIEKEIVEKIHALKAGEIALTQNIRFYPGEEKNDPVFAKKLASLGEIFVNDAFSVSHRAHASVIGIAKYLKAYAGLQMQEEVENLTKVFQIKTKPKIAVIGGAKLDTKIGVLRNLLKKMDLILLGGVIANNVLAAMGEPVGSSKVEKDALISAKKILSNKLIVPSDGAVAKKPDSLFSKIKKIKEVKKGELILDIGPRTVEIYAKILAQAKVVVWNGPLGYFENKKFRQGSLSLLKALAKSSAFKVIGGGETLELLRDSKVNLSNCFVSTGGGAMLEFLEGKVLPGIKPLIK